MRPYFKHIAILSFFLCVFATGFAQDDLPQRLNPKRQGLDNWVSNPDNILDKKTVLKLNTIANTLYDSTSAQVVVVALKGTPSLSARDLSMKLFDAWRPGSKKMDNGFIVVLCTESKQCFIRTGYGLEGCLTDAYTTRVFNNVMRPCFLRGNWGEGLVQGTLACVDVVYKFYDKEGGAVSKAKKRGSIIDFRFLWRIYLLIGFALFVVALSGIFCLSNKVDDLNRCDKYFDLKKFWHRWALLSIFFGIWYLPLLFVFYRLGVYHIRHKTVRCTCGKAMSRLSEKQEDEFLNDRQQFEENICSRDYDVWLCKSCGKSKIFAYEKKAIYRLCPKCKVKAAYKTGEEIIVQPTRRAEGTLRTYYTCKHCRHKFHIDSPIDRLSDGLTIVPPIIIGGGFSGGMSGGGFSGGGFSGGGFGGGMSGGGGGGGSW